ncbi:MAG: hypothetical protein OEX97_14435 [Acidimicrobiia bacterium]|nr:hypothetical protein [Acidimicrobiia bacterium]
MSVYPPAAPAVAATSATTISIPVTIIVRFSLYRIGRLLRVWAGRQVRSVWLLIAVMMLPGIAPYITGRRPGPA